jgi:hypothetical protein
MPDHGENPIVPDFRRVIIHEEHELNYWTKEFGISKKDLKQAVMEVGTSAEAVKKYLEEKSKITSLLADPALKLNALSAKKHKPGY